MQNRAGIFVSSTMTPPTFAARIWRSLIFITASHESAKKNGQYLYTARIHIKGNYIIGRYNSEQEAAIAYNKAIDILKKNGVKKNYTANYIDGITPSKYAEIYNSISVSPKIVNYRPPTSPSNQ